MTFHVFGLIFFFPLILRSGKKEGATKSLIRNSDQNRKKEEKEEVDLGREICPASPVATKAVAGFVVGLGSRRPSKRGDGSKGRLNMRRH